MGDQAMNGGTLQPKKGKLQERFRIFLSFKETGRQRKA